MLACNVYCILRHCKVHPPWFSNFISAGDFCLMSESCLLDIDPKIHGLKIGYLIQVYLQSIRELLEWKLF